ncbi:thioredoxin family protein [Mangrovivirga cuniculi]|uniref:Thioredoxin domain-containing protein n=1 Tax=Mangrovivirga cuniculi TaxID=2715131 RepID=A0A4D7JJB5_9BACT|nr:thioredoxin family protein [Mangrovivirga cuniculi]QCK13500.1 hypothetical protein DCC35_01385 [Mangrovivirga cuniculi]
MIKKSFILVFFLFGFNSLFSQISWETNLKVAQVKAIEKDQLILVDFWAIWCGPCKKMDKQLWERPEMKKLSENFVALKIDIDQYPNIARAYNVTSIPRVMIITASEEVIWEKNGFLMPESYIEILKQIPPSLNGLNKKMVTNAGEENPNSSFEIGMGFQKLAISTKSDFGMKFINISNSYFKEVEKKLMILIY